ncbi:MAG: TetR/AcrR family transcriptional regulator [Nocardioidaceae bacterium]
MGAAQSPSVDPSPRARKTAAADRRRERTAEIVAATRALFDERGVRDAQIEDIANAVGINRAIIYRHFSGKEELFAMTLATYLDELVQEMAAADDESHRPAARLRAVASAFLVYGEQHPPFVDCAQALLSRPGTELMQDVSEAALFRLGRSIANCLGRLVRVLEAGVATGDFVISKPDLLANVLYTQALGGLHLARLQLSVREATPGFPEVAVVSFDEVKDYLIEAAVAMAAGAGSR